MRKIQAMTLILGAAIAGLSQAATTTTSFAVTATVNSTCSATATALGFGAYVPGAYTDTITVTITY